jgi:hypothetical protein
VAAEGEVSPVSHRRGEMVDGRDSLLKCCGRAARAAVCSRGAGMASEGMPPQCLPVFLPCSRYHSRRPRRCWCCRSLLVAIRRRLSLLARRSQLAYPPRRLPRLCLVLSAQLQFIFPTVWSCETANLTTRLVHVVVPSIAPSLPSVATTALTSLPNTARRRLPLPSHPTIAAVPAAFYGTRDHVLWKETRRPGVQEE